MTRTGTIFFTVTNDLAFDQRMQRICSSMVKAGYNVTLVGRTMPDSPTLPDMPYRQKRIQCRFTKGKLFYLEYNIKLYRFLKQQKMDAVCAIDLDTIVPVYLVSQKRRIPRMYDAHEFFTEMIEVKRRPWIHFTWKKIEQWLVPKFKHGYTVGHAIAAELKKCYGVSYGLVRNVPYTRLPPQPGEAMPESLRSRLEKLLSPADNKKPVLVYQGAINEGRALLSLVEAMKQVDAILILAGKGNLFNTVKEAITSSGQSHKIFMPGNIPPNELPHLTAISAIGITLFDNFSLNQYYSLANKFFDYIMAAKPQLCVNYPEYAAILQQHAVALPIIDVQPQTIANGLNKLLGDSVLYRNMVEQCKKASLELNWEKEEAKLLSCWDDLLDSKLKTYQFAKHE